MKNVLNNTILAAATLAISMTPVMAESPTKLKAEIPFAFHVGNQSYAAGTYEASILSTSTGAKVLVIKDQETGVAHLSQGMAPANSRQSDDNKAETRLVFSCVSSGCALSQVWVRRGEPGVQFRTPKQQPNETMRIATVRLLPTSAD